jgi:hypothetical protein
MSPKSGRKGMKAYVLIETAPGKTKTVRKELGGVSKGALATLDAIGRLVTDEIGTINGVTRTTTCVAVSLG